MRVPKQISDAIRILVQCQNSGDELVKIAVVAEELDLTKQMALKLSNILRQLSFSNRFGGQTAASVFRRRPGTQRLEKLCAPS